MEAHAYREEVAGKGANNVASMLLQYCCGVRNWLIDDKEGMQSSLIMDNCRGQNKTM